MPVINVRRGDFRPGDQVQLTDEKGRRHRLVLAAGQAFHTHRGAVAHDDLIGQPEGSVVKASGGTLYVALRPLLADYTVSMANGSDHDPSKCEPGGMESAMDLDTALKLASAQPVGGPILTNPPNWVQTGPKS